MRGEAEHEIGRGNAQFRASVAGETRNSLIQTARYPGPRWRL